MKQTFEIESLGDTQLDATFMRVALEKYYNLPLKLKETMRRTLGSGRHSTTPIKVNVTCVVLNGRIIASDYGWDEEQQHCVHGVKLRWGCDWCGEALKQDTSQSSPPLDPRVAESM